MHIPCHSRLEAHIRTQFLFLQKLVEKKACIFLFYLLVYQSMLFSFYFFERGGSIMAKCEFCDKGVTFGIQVSHSHRRSNRTWKPNVKRVKAVVNGTPKHVYVCTRCLRSGKVTRAV